MWVSRDDRPFLEIGDYFGPDRRFRKKGTAPGEERRADRSVVVGLTDTMARVFANAGPGQALLGLSLGVLDTVNPARNLLAELMMFGRR